jgi:peptide/nickel transport system permease protein
MALTMLTATVVGVSIPSFFLALLIQIGSIEFYQRTGIRVVFFGPNPGGGNSLLPKIALPALVLVARPLAHISRVTFVSLSEVLERDFVRTARAKGVRELLVFWRHVLRNAGVSILTAIGVSLRFALGSLPVAEIFFDWPGLGGTLLNGIFQRDTNVVAGAALGLGVTFLLINMGLDLIYRVMDPRLRRSDNGGAS